MRISALKRHMIAAVAVSAFALGSTPASANEPEDQVSFVYLTIQFHYDTLLDLLRFR